MSTENLELKGKKDATSHQIIEEGEEMASVEEVW